MEISTRNHLILHQSLTSRQKITMLALSYGAGPDGVSHATNGQLVAMTSLGPRRLQYTLSSLARRGFIERITSGPGAATSRQIRLALEALKAPQAAAC